MTIRITDVPDGKVDISCDEPPPDTVTNEPCELSRLMAWFMLYAAEKILNDSPVRRCGFLRQASVRGPRIKPR